MMKMMYNYSTLQNETSTFVYYRYNIFEPSINKVLNKLDEIYADNDRYRNYRGLCNEASSMLVDEISRRLQKKCVKATVKEIHGELAHSTKILSKYWPTEHTMVYVKVSNIEAYIDPTCGQFNDIIPHMYKRRYISEEPPWWFLEDRDNIAWCKLFSRNYKVQKIIQSLQYDIWGRISDIIYNIRRKINNGSCCN